MLQKNIKEFTKEILVLFEISLSPDKFKLVKRQIFNYLHSHILILYSNQAEGLDSKLNNYNSEIDNLAYLVLKDKKLDIFLNKKTVKFKKLIFKLNSNKRENQGQGEGHSMSNNGS